MGLKGKVINFSYPGFKHLKDNIPCQDYSATHEGKDFYMIGVADGHGSEVYFRSHIGSRYAVLAAFEELEKFFEYKVFNVESSRSLKLKILSHWNKLIENDLKREPISTQELEKLSDKDFAKIKKNPVTAYGTTLTCALISEQVSIVVSIGDSNAMYYDQEFIPHQLLVSDDEDEANTNITNSLCEEDAFNNIRVEYLFSKVNALALSTDGALNPYQKFADYEKHVTSNFLSLAYSTSFTEAEKSLDNFILQLANEKGTGDDVSFAIFYLTDFNKEAIKLLGFEALTENMKRDIKLKYESEDKILDYLRWLSKKYNDFTLKEKFMISKLASNNNLVFSDDQKQISLRRNFESGFDPIVSMILVKIKK